MTDTTQPTLDSIYPNVDLTHSLKEHYKKHTLIDKAVNYIKLIPAYGELKLDPQLTLLVLDIIQNEINKLPGSNIIDLLIQILNTVFSLTDLENEVIKLQIKFLNNNKHVKGIPFSKKFLKSSVRWFTRKLG
jgi:hypothetical protein